MANTIKHKRGTTTPTAGQLVVGEIAINTTTGGLFTKTDAGSVISVGGGGTWGSITGTLSSQTDLQNALNLKATLASPALTGNVTITTNSSSPALIIVQDGAGDIVQFKDVTSDSTYSFIDAAGKVSTIATTTSNAGLNIPHGTAPTSPVNGDIWTTTSGVFVRVNSNTQTLAPINAPTFTGSASSTTPTSSDNSTRIATTAFVKAQSYITSSSLTGYALLTGTSAIQVTGATIRSIDGSDNFVSLAQGVLNFGNTATGVSGLSVSGTGITFPDSTVQTTATIAGPAGASGAMNYLDMLTVTSSAAGYYESSGTWTAYFGFMNTSAGWFYNKLNTSGVDFKLYINGTYDSTANSAYNNSSASGTLAGSPTTGDVITIFISDGTSDATIPLVTYTY